jgi:hypothetical protein
MEKQKRRAPSTSAVLDEILQEKRQEHEHAQFEAAVATYYDSLDEEQATENQKWGEFSETQFSSE